MTAAGQSAGHIPCMSGRLRGTSTRRHAIGYNTNTDERVTGINVPRPTPTRPRGRTNATLNATFTTAVVAFVYVSILCSPAPLRIRFADAELIRTSPTATRICMGRTLAENREPTQLWISGRANTISPAESGAARASDTLVLSTRIIR